MSDQQGRLTITTRHKPVPDAGYEHKGCDYNAPVFEQEDGIRFWFCNECGSGGAFVR